MAGHRDTKKDARKGNKELAKDKNHKNSKNHKEIKHSKSHKN